MIAPKKILFPTDFSEASNHALPHVVEMSKRFGAEVTMIHVRSPYADDPHSEEYQFFDENRYSSFLERELARTSESLSGVPVQSVIRRDVSPASGILEFSDEEKCDIIILGTHGRSGLGRFFLGSVAERVVRHSTIPVLTVAPGREGYRDNPRYQQILATFDFSQNSRIAAVRARELADAYGAHLRILYVIEQEILPGYYESWRQQVRLERPELVERARESLLDVLGEHGLQDVEVKVEVGDGDGRVHLDIQRFAVESETDLIVIGTHGLSGVERILLGSTTERIVRIAPCPVLTLHPGN
jgi:nucleotide-binding universal stress UspA family protein